MTVEADQGSKVYGSAGYDTLRATPRSASAALKKTMIDNNNENTTDQAPAAARNEPRALRKTIDTINNNGRDLREARAGPRRP